MTQLMGKTKPQNIAFIYAYKALLLEQEISSNTVVVEIPTQFVGKNFKSEKVDLYDAIDR